MLTLMRKNVGWALKGILGIIALSFILYFGYTGLGRQKVGDSVAIRVGDEEIPFGKYRFFYNNEYESARDQFKDQDIPEYYTRLMENRARQYLVFRTLARQFAHRIGIAVTDQELADTITKNPEFDPIAYKDYLKYFYGQNGFSFEDLQREELLVNKFQNWSLESEPVSAPESDKTSWVFETVIIEDPKQKELAEEIQAAWAKGAVLKTLLKKNHVEVKKTEPLTLADRFNLFNDHLSIGEYASLFGLSEKNPALPKPIEKNGRFLLARLVEKKTPPTEPEAAKESKRPAFSIIDLWFRHFAEQTKVESFITTDNS